jgi:hypothetical protein
LLAAALWGATAACADTNSPAAQRLNRMEAVRRAASELYARRLAEKAEAAMERKAYREAIGLFAQARVHAGERAEMEELRARIREGLGKGYYYRARQLLRMKEIDKAAVAASEAAALACKPAEGLLKRLQKMKKGRD